MLLTYSRLEDRERLLQLMLMPNGSNKTKKTSNRLLGSGTATIVMDPVAGTPGVGKSTVCGFGPATLKRLSKGVFGILI